MKKLLFLLVALLTSVGVWALDFEVDGIKYTVVSEEDKTVEVSGYNSSYEGDLVINGTVSYNEAEYKVVSINSDNSPFYSCDKLKSIGNMPYCTSIGDGAFDGCSSLTSVGDLSACTSIGGSAFYCCSSLTSVGDLSACTSIGGSAFAYCSCLTSVGDLSACTSIGEHAFEKCSSLTSVGDLSACTSIGGNAFYICSSLTSVGDLSACTSIGEYAFACCSSLTSIGDLSACTSIGNCAFASCSSLTSVGDLSACTSIGVYAFDSCSSLTSVGDLSACTSIESSAFEGVEKVIISNNTPPTLSGVPTDAGTTFLVPASAVADYRAAEYWSDIKTQIISKDAHQTWDVAAPVLTSIGPGNFENVITLKLSGNIDSDDIMYIRNKMANLHHLDMTNVTILSSDKEYATGKKTTANHVGGFNGLTRLRTVKLPTSATRIEGNAFCGCTWLRNVTIPEGITSIEGGDGAFNGCTALTTVQLPEGMTTIGYGAFSSCNKLKTVAFPSTLITIGASAFAECNLSSINLPTSLVTIEDNAFYNNTSLSELHIPSSVESIGAEAFSSCHNLKDIYSYTAEPVSINTNTFSTYAAATLHVFKMENNEIFNNYYADPQWGQFPSLVTFDAEYKYFYLNNDMTLESRFTDEPDFNGKEGSTLEVVGDGDQQFDDVVLDYTNDKGASVIADDNVKAHTLTFRLPVTGNRWYFYSFPFRVYLNKVTAPGSYVFRCYDGALRALHGATGWAALEDGTEYLEPGVGYIFQTNTTGTLVIEVDDPDFYWHGHNKTNPLTAHAPGQGISDQHASWNFVGNPMTNYYDIDDMDYTAPLTIWNGSSYVAYRPGDDNYQLSPFEAFFVQKPASGNDPTYQKEHRMGYNAAQEHRNNKAAAKAASSRLMNTDPNARNLMNLVLSNGTAEDKTRVVFNKNKTARYEMDCDAAKFMSTEQVPQIYTVDQQVRYAINERQQGSVQIGYTAPAAGTYTLRAERMDMPVVVKDLLMGTTHNMMNGEMTFETEAGTFENRFVLMPASDVTAISNVKTEGAETEAESIYSLDGKQKHAATKGVNIVRKGNEVQKVITK